MTTQEKLMLAKLLSRIDQTIPMIFSIIELTEQKPLSEKEREEIKEHIK